MCAADLPAQDTHRTLRVSGIEIPAALTLPLSEQITSPLVASLILLVPGSLFSDVDGNYPAWNMRPRVYAYLAEQLARAGHAVYRFAKIGPDTGSKVVDEEAARSVLSFAGRSAIAAAALSDARDALAEAGIQVRSTILAGHSEGAVVVSQLAPRQSAVDGVVLLSGPSVGLLSIMREQACAMLAAAGRQNELTQIDAAHECIRRGETIPQALADASQSVAMLQSMGEASLAYLRQVDAVDPCETAVRVEQPVLIVQGGRDASVPPHHADRLRQARQDLPTDMLLVPELQHFYKPLPPGTDPAAAFGIEGPTDSRVSAGIDDWIRRVIDR